MLHCAQYHLLCYVYPLQPLVFLAVPPRLMPSLTGVDLSMSRVIRFAESVWSAATVQADTLLLRLEPCYGLQSEGIPGVDTTTLWVHVVELTLTEAEWTDLPDLPVTLTGAEVRDPPHLYRAHLPLPYQSRGALRFTLQLDSGASWVVQARAANLRVLSGRYLHHLEAP